MPVSQTTSNSYQISQMTKNENTMKFIHLSDTHIRPKPQKIRGIDVHARLEAAVESINKNFSDAELCMVTGDLTDQGDAESYTEVCEILDRLEIPWHGLMGNHDKGNVARATLSHFPWQERSEERRVGKSVDLGGRRIIK